MAFANVNYFFLFFLSAPSVNKTVYSGKIDSVSITVNVGNITKEKVNTSRCTRVDPNIIPVSHNAPRFKISDVIKFMYIKLYTILI